MSQGENERIQRNVGRRYALVVGVNSPARVPELPALTYAESDALGFSWLLERAESGFALPNAALLGSAADTQAVRHAMSYLIDERSKDDLLLFYFAGHGYPVDTSDGEREVYLATADFDPYLAKLDPSSCLSLNWLRRMLFERNKANVIVILDCCYSGNVLAASRLQPQDIQESLQQFQPREMAREQARRSLLLLASTATDTTAYEARGAHRGGHALMTDLLLRALSGRNQEALDSNGDVTLRTLCRFLQKQLSVQSSQIQGYFPQDLILAHHPMQNPFLQKLEDFLPSPEISETWTSAPPTRFFDTSICREATFADLDEEQIETFFQNERTALQDDYLTGVNTQKQMEAFGFWQGGHPSYGALLCFGSHPARYITGAYTRCILWNNTDRLTGWQDDREYRGSLLEQFVRARDFLRKSLHFERLIGRGGSRELPEIPFRVLDEILVNALVHREYVSLPAFRPRSEGSVIEIFTDRIEISSPGILPTGIEIETLQKASGRRIKAYPRNPQIARIFYLAGYMEIMGAGIERTSLLMQEANLPQPLFHLKQSTQTLTVTLMRPSFGKEQPSQPKPGEKRLSSDDPETWPSRPASLPLPDLLAPGNVNPFRNPQATTANPFQGEEIASENPFRNPQVTSKNPFRDPQATGENPFRDPQATGENPFHHLRAWSESKSPFSASAMSLRRSTEPLHDPFTPQELTPQMLSKSIPVGVPASVRRQPGRVISLVSASLLIAALFLSSAIAYLHGVSLFAAQGTTPPVVSGPSMTIEIGSDFATGGVDRASGLPLQYGVQMAIDQANSENLIPGYIFKLRPFNDVGTNNRFDPTVGKQNITQAAADGLIAGVVGPGTSSVAQKELPVANRASLPLLSPDNTYPCLTRSSSVDPTCSGSNNILPQMRPTGQLTYFRLAATDDLQGKVTADYFFATLHHRRVVVIEDESDLYSQGLTQAFQHEFMSLGGFVTPLNLPEASSGVMTYQLALEAVISTQPDLVYFAGNSPNGSYALQALANIPVLNAVAFAGGDGVVNSGFLQVASQLQRSAPVYVSLPITDPAHANTPAGTDFQENYIASGYNDYNPYVASSYDCAMMLIQAVKVALQSGVSTPHGSQDHTGATRFRQAVLKALAHLHYIGATGSQGFDVNGDTTNQVISFYRLNISQPQPNWQWLQQNPVQV